MTSVLFYVQHLQGIGHVVRSRRIAEALARAGFDVSLVLGGLPVDGLAPDGLNVIQLPPLKAGPASFRDLLTATGEVADSAYKDRRREMLLDAFDITRPDIVLIEAFPFDRPQMHFELVPLLEQAATARPRPLIVSSIRDILQFKPNPDRDRTALELLESYFDHVLVHGAPALAKLGDTFRHADRIAGMVTYTGIVAPAAPSAPPDERFDVIISTGGGATDGHALLDAAMRARPLSRVLRDARWLALTGPYVDAVHQTSLASTAAMSGVTLRAFVPGLANLLAAARVSISQAGYNTVADLLRTGCRAVLCPYAGIRQNEQSERAARLAAGGWAVAVPHDEISPEAIAVAVDRATAMPVPRHSLDLDGASRTASVLQMLYSQWAR